VGKALVGHGHLPPTDRRARRPRGRLAPRRFRRPPFST